MFIFITDGSAPPRECRTRPSSLGGAHLVQHQEDASHRHAVIQIPRGVSTVFGEMIHLRWHVVTQVMVLEGLTVFVLEGRMVLESPAVFEGIIQ